MIIGTKCPECRSAPLKEREPRVAHFPWSWKYCPACGWDEKQQMQDKIREELANGPERFDL